MIRTGISPFAILLIALLSIPLLEIYLLISVGRSIGAGATVLVVIFTAILGTWLLRQQGLNTLARVRGATQQGQLPAIELIEGLILLVCAVMLLTPGFFTDALGFVALIPTVRRRMAGALMHGFVNRSEFKVDVGDVGGAQSNVIEGDYRREDAP
ncbi:MAG: UPF0716 protein FxsA [Gammaproteobacteria bacterium]|jgi:UPF0716 protein FxsA